MRTPSNTHDVGNGTTRTTTLLCGIHPSTFTQHGNTMTTQDQCNCLFLGLLYHARPVSQLYASWQRHKHHTSLHLQGREYHSKADCFDNSSRGSSIHVDMQAEDMQAGLTCHYPRAHLHDAKCMHLQENCAVQTSCQKQSKTDDFTITYQPLWQQGPRTCGIAAYSQTLFGTPALQPQC